MHWTMKLALCLLGSTLLLVAGCQKLNITKTIVAEPGEYKVLRTPAPKKDQKIQVAINSADGDVSVYLVVGIDPKLPDDAIEELLNDKTKGQIVDKKTQVREATLEGTLPAGTEAAVIFAHSTKPTSITVKITGD
jgi:hypothetical protein